MARGTSASKARALGVVINTDGSGLVRVTGGEDDTSIWGTPSG
jgi:hypothetical protein